MNRIQMGQIHTEQSRGGIAPKHVAPNLHRRCVSPLGAGYYVVDSYHRSFDILDQAGCATCKDRVLVSSSIARLATACPGSGGIQA